RAPEGLQALSEPGPAPPPAALPEACLRCGTFFAASPPAIEGIPLCRGCLPTEVPTPPRSLFVVPPRAVGRRRFWAGWPIGLLMIGGVLLGWTAGVRLVLPEVRALPAAPRVPGLALLAGLVLPVTFGVGTG